MQKKLLAVAVAGALAAPVAAMAQSSVTISGVFKVGFDQYKVANPGTARAGLNTSEYRVTDNSSRIIFGMTEDIGGGTAGIAQIDMRAGLDTGTLTASGNTWVGLRGSSWGSLTMGRHDLHYGKQPDDIAAKAGALMAAAVSIMDYNYKGTAIAGATRTPNVVRYDSPNWSGFAFTLAYSTTGSPTTEADLSTGIRKGYAWNINPSYTAGNWAVGYSYWKQQADAGGADANQTGNVLYGYWSGGGFKVGAAVNQSKTSNVAAAGGAETTSSDRRNYTVPVSWTSGSHNIYAHYTKAGKDKVGGDGTDAKMYALAYVYDLSKRTSVGVTYAKIDNNRASAYNFFTNTGGLGSTNATLTAGEDGQLIQGTIRHAF